MLTIWKYRIGNPDSTIVYFNGKSLSVGLNADGYPCVWAQVDPDAPATLRGSHEFRFTGTGHPLPDDMTHGFPQINPSADLTGGWRFLGTASGHAPSGAFVAWHVFERC